MLKLIPLLLTGLLLWTAPAWAAITIGTSVSTASVGGGGATTLAAPAIAITSGQSLIVCTKWEGNFTLTGFADTSGNTYVLGTTQQHSALEPSARCGWVISPAVAASNVITATYSGAAPYRRISVYSFNKNGSTLTFDAQSANSTEDNADTTPSSANVTATGTDEICFGYHGDYTTQSFLSETINSVARDGRVTQTDTDLWYKIFTAGFTGPSSLTRGASERWIQRVTCFTASGGAPPPIVTGTTYYVATTGSDANPGTVGSPFRNPQRCQTFMVAGDTCEVDDGTYTDTDGNGIVVYVSGGGTGTQAKPITYKSKNRLGAIISVGAVICSTCTTSSSYEGFHVTKNYYVIDGFDIVGTGSFATPGNVSWAGINNTDGVTGTVIKNNSIHSIGRNVCSTSGLGFAGIFNLNPVNVLIDSNKIYSIGRKRVGELGCAASVPNDANDHGIYAHGGSLVITRNVFWDDTRGWAFQSSPVVMSSLVFANNTVDGKSSTGVPAGQFQINGGVTSGLITNNIFSNPQTSVFRIGAAWNTSSIVYDYNLTDSTDANMIFETPLAGMTDGGHNLTSTSPGFTSIGTNDYTLAAGSAAINAGTSTAVTCGVSNCDIGRYERFGFNSASITGNTMLVTANMNIAANNPILPATGMTGWTVNNGRTVTAAVRATGTDSVASLTISGAACADVDTWTVTYAPGNVTDTPGQPMTAFSAQAVTNVNCSGGAAPTYEFTHKTHQFLDAMYATGTTNTVPLSAIDAANTNVHSGIPFAVDLQTDCTIANCPSIGQRLFYSRTPLATGTPSAFAALTDVSNGTDQIGFYGTTADQTILHGPLTAVCLTGALTPTAGTTLQTSAAIPIFDLPLNGCTVNRYVLTLGGQAILGDIYTFKLYQQDGTAFTTYSPVGGAKITVTPVSPVTTPTGPHEVGASSNSIIEIVWTAFDYPNLIGYHIYQCSTSPCTSANWTLAGTNTITKAIATHSSLTTFRTNVSAGGTYYYVISAFDSGGQESTASSEVAITRTGPVPRTQR